MGFTLFGGFWPRVIFHPCPDCKAETRFLGGRSGITENGMYFAVKEYECPKCGLRHEESPV